MKDIAGNDITVGSKVGFASRKGTSAWMILGEVVEVDIKLYEGSDRRGLAVRTQKGATTYKNPKEVLVYG